MQVYYVEFIGIDPLPRSRFSVNINSCTACYHFRAIIAQSCIRVFYDILESEKYILSEKKKKKHKLNLIQLNTRLINLTGFPAESRVREYTTHAIYIYYFTNP